MREQALHALPSTRRGFTRIRRQSYSGRRRHVGGRSGMIITPLSGYIRPGGVSEIVLGSPLSNAFAV